jgi:pyridoxine 5-phosphate synthase
MARLGVNIDHVATLRQARRVAYPDPLEAARLAERGGAEAVTVHLREDRRHIQDYDLFALRSGLRVHLNQELAPIEEMVELAVRLRPHEVCMVPERRAELTTEGGLDAAGQAERLAPLVRRLRDAKIVVSLFVDPEKHQLEAAGALGAEFVELHTGRYANLADADLTGRGAGSKAQLGEAALAELEGLRAAADAARSLRLKCNAGHGLNYRNVGPIAALRGLQWLHIGHAIVARAVMVGMVRAVREMKALLARPDLSIVPRPRPKRQKAPRRASRS